MSQDPLASVMPGQPIVFSASRENKVSEVLSHFARQNSSFGASEETGLVDDPTLILVRNDIGQDLDRYHVIKVGGPIFGPDDNLTEFQERPSFKALAITANSEQYAVLQEPIPAEVGGRKSFGVARIFGPTIGKVTRSTATISTPEYASTGADRKFFNGNASGSIQVLWREGKVGEQWAYLFLRAGRGSTCPPINTIWQVVIWGSLQNVSGNFRLQYKADETDPLDHDASAADMQTALEALPSIGTGNVRVTGGSYSWTVEFIEDMANAAAGPLAIDGFNLLGTYLGFQCYQVQSGHN